MCQRRNVGEPAKLRYRWQESVTDSEHIRAQIASRARVHSGKIIKE